MSHFIYNFTYSLLSSSSLVVIRFIKLICVLHFHISPQTHTQTTKGHNTNNSQSQSLICDLQCKSSSQPITRQDSVSPTRSTQSDELKSRDVSLKLFRDLFHIFSLFVPNFSNTLFFSFLSGSGRTEKKTLTGLRSFYGPFLESTTF